MEIHEVVHMEGEFGPDVLIFCPTKEAADEVHKVLTGLLVERVEVDGYVMVTVTRRQATAEARMQRWR